MPIEPVRKRGRKPSLYCVYRDKSLIDFYLLGNTLGQTGRWFNLTPSRVHRILVDHERAEGRQLLRHDRGRPPSLRRAG